MPSQLNQLHLMEIFLDLDVLKMILDIFHAEPDLVKKTFYSNDLKVLCDILCQDLLDSDVKSVSLLNIYLEEYEFYEIFAGTFILFIFFFLVFFPIRFNFPLF